MSIDLSNVPNKIGVYLWKNKPGKVIYIGKALELKDKMQQYFNGNLTPKNEILLKNISSFEIEVFDTQHEALEREQELIEQYEPIFNIKIKSAKIYPYIEVKSGSKFKLTVSKTKKYSRAKYFGPYPDGKIARSIINMWTDLFSINENMNAKEQKEVLEKIESFYKGDLEESYSILNNKSESGQDVEKEILLLRNIDINTEKLFDENQNFDIINYFVDDDLISISMTYIRKGIKGITANFVNKLFNPYPEDAVIAFLSRFYSRNPLPTQIIVPFELKWDLEINTDVKTPYNKVLKSIMSETLIDAESRISKNVEGFIGGIKHYARALEFMRTNIGYRSNIDIIEFITINGKKDEPKLGTVVQFLEGKERKDGYRKYVLPVESSIKDLIEAHIKNKLEKNLIFADVLIMDSKKDLDIAIDSYNKLGIKQVSLIAIDNEDSAVTNVMYNDDNERFEIEFNSHIYTLLNRMKIESKRFSNSFHRNRSDRMIIESKLDKFKFLNEIDKQRLVKEFKSIKRIMIATEEELGKIITRTQIRMFIKERENK